jgi:hypothetical protein
MSSLTAEAQARVHAMRRFLWAVRCPGVGGDESGPPPGTPSAPPGLGAAKVTRGRAAPPLGRSATPGLGAGGVARRQSDPPRGNSTG